MCKLPVQIYLNRQAHYDALRADIHETWLIVVTFSNLDEHHTGDFVANTVSQTDRRMCSVYNVLRPYLEKNACS